MTDVLTLAAAKEAARAAKRAGSSVGRVQDFLLSPSIDQDRIVAFFQDPANLRAYQFLKTRGDYDVLIGVLGETNQSVVDDVAITQEVVLQLLLDRPAPETLAELIADDVVLASALSNRQTIADLFSSPDALEAITANRDAMNVVTASPAAMDALIVIPAAMDAVIASPVALDALAASPAAINAVFASTVAINAVFASPAALDALAASPTAMDTVVASSTALDAVIASPAAMDAVAASSTAMDAVAASSTAMDKVVASPDALGAVFGSYTARSAMFLQPVSRDALSAPEVVDWLEANVATTLSVTFPQNSSGETLQLFSGKALLLEWKSNSSASYSELNFAFGVRVGAHGSTGRTASTTNFTPNFMFCEPLQVTRNGSFSSNYNVRAMCVRMEEP